MKKYAVTALGELLIDISFDPNLRPPLWNDMEEAKARSIENKG